MKMPRTLTIDRKLWNRGDTSDLFDGEKFCAVGFLFKEMGMKVSLMKNEGCLGDMLSTLYAQEDVDYLKSFSYALEDDWVEDIFVINDCPIGTKEPLKDKSYFECSSEEAREEKLTTVFEDCGIQLEFV